MLTPIELRNKQLKTGRGYNKKEADEFLEEVFADYEKLYKQNLEFKEKIGILSEGVQYYKSIESTLQKALVLAEKTAKETCDVAKTKANNMEEEAKQKAESLNQEAKKKAEDIEREAKIKQEELLSEAKSNAEHIEKDANLKAEKTLKEARSEKERLTAECISLVQQYNSFKTQFKKLMSSQLDMLDEGYLDIYNTKLKSLINDSKEDVSPWEADVPESDDVQSMEAPGVEDVKVEKEFEERGAIPDAEDVKEEDGKEEKEVDEGEATSDAEGVKEEKKIEEGEATPDVEDVKGEEEREEGETIPDLEDVKEEKEIEEGKATPDAEDVDDALTKEEEETANGQDLLASLLKELRNDLSHPETPKEEKNFEFLSSDE